MMRKEGRRKEEREKQERGKEEREGRTQSRSYRV
jgi:hypothetical protein